MSVSSVRNTLKDKMSSPWFRMDQLLRCSVCSSRYRNPKLLPCNHTFCAEPCLERAVERGKGQVKCPECSAEHRLPIPGGVQGFPNNVTLARFLELRQQVTGREPDLPASMQKCNTCKEKGALETCAHCNRKICKDCKNAHVKILRKEIALINSQVREGLKDLCTALRNTEENADKLQKNYAQVKDEIEEVVRRYTRDLLDTESKLKHHLDVYLKSELKSMRQLEHDLQIELHNVNSNCDLVDKYVNNGVDWTDAELTDYKEIFQRTLDFLRHFDSDPTDCVRKVRFHPRSDPDVVHKTLIDFAEVKLNDEVICQPNSGSEVNGVDGPTVTLTPPQNSALSRSQSDHKLANLRQSQKRGEAGRNQGEEVEPMSRRLRDRFSRENRDSCERELSNNREHSPSSWRKELDEARSNNQRNRFASRETIDELDCYEPEVVVPKKKPFRIPEDGRVSPNRDHVSETEDATKGPLSGVIRILDSPHVMERLHNSEVRQKRQKEEEERRARMPAPAPPPVHRPMARQMSEDEIEKQKRENKAAAAAAATSSAKLSESSRTKPATKKDDEPPLRSYATSKHTTTTSRDSSPPARTRMRNETAPTRGQREDTQSPRLRTSWRTMTNDREVSNSPPSSPTRNKDTQKPPVSPRTRDVPTPTRPASRSLLTKSSSLEHDDPPAENSSTQRRPYFSPTLTAGRSSPLTKSKDGERPRLRLTIPSQEIESESSSSSESESEEDSDTAANRGDISPSVNALLARSSQARRQSASTQARLLGRQDDPPSRPGSGRSWRDTIRHETDASRDAARRRNAPDPEERTTSPYSRLLESRRRSSITSSGGGRTRDVSPEKDSFAARRNRIARSKSSHDLIAAEDSPEDDTLSAIRSRYRTRAATREKSPEEQPPHSWSQYMKNKYGRTGTSGGGLVRSLTSASLAIRKSDSENSSDDDSAHRRREYRRGDSSSPRGFSMPRRTYMQKGKAALKFGSRGTDHGHFTWPRGVCVGPENTVVVADSNNHRVQVFNSSGKFIQEFGSYGSNEGEFDCLAAVTVNRIGQYIVSDRYNHRLQVFDPSGRFVRAFGSEGRTDGKFSYPWGVATDNLGFIYVCDKENHRIQIRFECPFVPAISSGRPGMILKECKTIPSGAGPTKSPEGVPRGRHLRHQVRGHRPASGGAGAPPLRGRVLDEPRDRERLQQPPRADLRRERAAAVHLRHRGLRGGTVQVPEGGGRRRPGIPHRGRLREQQDTDLPSGRDVPAGVRDVGFRGRRVQRSGGHCRLLYGTDPRLRPGEPQDTGILRAKKHPKLRTWFYAAAPKMRPFPHLPPVKLLSLRNV